LLIYNEEGGKTFGIDNDTFAYTASLSIMAAYFGLNFLRPGTFGGAGLRSVAIWLVLALALVAGYQYREPLQDFASTVTAGLIPASPRSSLGADGGNVVSIGKSDNGHFEVNAEVNGATLRFLVDTGATSIALSAEDAAAIGIDMAGLTYVIPISTANGEALAAAAMIDEITIGTIIRRNLRAVVAKEGAMDGSLLGMEYLNSLSSFTVKQDELQLND
jgi:aspartyl protease family protein